MRLAFLAEIIAASALQPRPPGDAGWPDKDTNNCGAACVQMLCGFYKVEFPRETAVRMLRPGPNGETSLARMQQCLEEIGLSATVVRGDSQLIDELVFPTVVLVKRNRGDSIGHFAVVMTHRESGDLLAYDPFESSDAIHVDREVFARHWTGLALLTGPMHAHRGKMIAVVTFAVCGAAGAAALGRRRPMRRRAISV
ncbi:MAG TPA: cysteine peptidase family C39 domain-containing protein [Lacipirellulaceae bacterium]|nr:cysteine peptidase family C39 domain-containing protein [Lacipirellulaceae bacterium]